MGRKSTKINKNIFQLSREEAGLTREEAGELMDFVSADRIEKIENERVLPHPEDVVEMAKCYKDSSLRNSYCAEMCPLGQGYVEKLDDKQLSQITIEMLASLNALDSKKNRLIEIAVDGQITEDEYHDFAVINNQLENIASSVNSLKMWLEQMVYDGKIDPVKLEKAKQELK